MDADTSPSRSVTAHLRGALRVARGALRHSARIALDIALPTLCVACREPVAGEGVCATCWAKLSFIAPPYCPRLGSRGGPLDGTGRARITYGGRRAGPGPAALAAGLEPPLQPVRRAGAHHR